MSRAYDPRPMLDFILSYWRDYYRDTARIVRMWEGFVRLMDDEWAQAEQANDASNVWTCPTHVYHTYIHRKMTEWEHKGVPHFHYRKDFRAAAGQKIFYLGAWVSPEGLSVFVNGKEMDGLTDPFVVDHEQDATQPGTNPAGSRLVFTSPRVLNHPVSVFSSRELYRLDVEVPSGGLTSITAGRTIDPYSAKVTLLRLNITPSVTVSPTSLARANGELFKAGEILRVDDAGVIQTVVIQADAASVPLSSPVTPLTTRVYKNIGVDITGQGVWLEGTSLRSSKPFPANTRIRITDVYGTMNIVVQTPSTVLPLTRVVDNESARVYFLSGEVLDAYKADSSGLTFNRSFQEGTVIRIEAAIDEPNDHAAHHEITTSPVSTISVSPQRPFNLSPVLTELPGFPIQLYVGGILQHPDTYTFASTARINLGAAIPAGVEVDIHYVDLEEPRAHQHVDVRIEVAQARSAFVLPDNLSRDWARYVSVNGAVIGDEAERWFNRDGNYLTFANALPQGSTLRVRGARFSYGFTHAIDPELVRADFLQNGIDQMSGTIPAGWTTQMKWEEGFFIENGVCSSNEPIESAWFVNAYVDERTGFRNFGSLIGFDRPTSDEYMRVLRALYSGSYMGCQRADIESLVCVLLGSQYLSHEEKVISVTDGQVVTERETLAIDPRVPVRVTAEETYRQLWAVSSFAEMVDHPPVDFLPQVAEDVSRNYRFAHTLDTRKPSLLDGGPVDFYTAEKRLEDLSTDFVEENVWPGDLVKLMPTGFTTVYARVIRVDRHALILDTDLVGYQVGYGQDGYGWWVYGGGLLIIPNVYYRVWTREIDRLDEEEMFDRAREEDIASLNDRISSFLSSFVYNVKVYWDAVRTHQSIEDLAAFLRRISPAESGFFVYAEVNDDEGISDAVAGAVDDADPVLEILPDFAYADEGNAGINGQTSPNAGSFVGVP